MWWNDGPYFTDERIKTVKDMYDYASENSIALLSEYLSSTVIASFWDEYVNNFELYDQIFCTRYKNLFFFDQDGTEDVDNVTSRFIDAVDGLLRINNKRYNELYKIEGLSIQSNSILSDYNMTEEKSAERGVEREYVSGARQDTSENTSGEREDVTTDQIMAYNSNSFVDQAKSTFEKGAEEDSSEYNKGEQTDNEDVSETSGRTITTSGTKGNPYENMDKFITAWDAYSFYGKIFEDIAKAFLLV